MASETDRIQKRVVLRAPLARVWKAISESSQFGSWFGAEFDAPFVAGKAAKGKIVPTKADPEVAAKQEPMRLFSFRWHPFAVEKDVDYSHEPTTLVTFELEEVAGGTRLTVTESGFDQLPQARRAKAFEMNADGWTHQMRLVEKYLAHAA